MVAVLFLVGQGLEPPSLVGELLDVERNPRRPAYQMAAETPLVLWDCIFAGGEPDAEKTQTALRWVYHGEDNPQNMHGTGGLASDLWRGWHEKKMDELLANRLLHLVTSQPQAGGRHQPRGPGGEEAAAAQPEGVRGGQRRAPRGPVRACPRPEADADAGRGERQVGSEEGLCDAADMRKARGWGAGSMAVDSGDE